MKNLLLLIFSILLALCVSEIAIRYMHLPFLLAMHDTAPAREVNKYGFFNPNSGTNQPNPKISLKYHFYPPHLRDTQVNPHAKHILVLGDSFTFGLHLPWEKTYIFQLQHEIDRTFGKNQYQLLNAGTPGWGTADYLSYLEHYGAEISPKFVLVFLNSDDIGRSIQHNTYKLANVVTPKAEENPRPFHQFLLSWQSRLFHTWVFRNSELLHLLYYESLSLINHYRGDPSVLPPMHADLIFKDDFAVRYAEALFQRMNQWCKQHHAKLIIVTTGFNALYPAEVHEPTKIFLTKATAFFAKENIPYYDIASSFKKAVNGKSFQIPKDGHPNEFGAQVIAQTSWPWINKQLLVKIKKD